jgi:alkylation response protein AidB-like acyl-CoA dehydrogenase
MVAEDGEQARRNAVWDQVARFCQARLGPAAAPPALLPRDAFRQLGEFGLLGLPVPLEFGGRGATCVELTTHLEAFGYACQDNGLLMSVVAHVAGCVVPVFRVGTEEQRRRFLPRLCSGEWLAAIAATEPNAGSDLFSLQTVLEECEGGYLLSGRKTYVLNATDADVVVVLATARPGSGARGLVAVLVERGAAGMRVGRVFRKSGLRTAPLAELEFERCFVPSHNRLGAAGGGALVFHLAMLWERTLALAPHVGTMQRVLEKCIGQAKRRVQFGKAIGKFQSVSNRIADMKVRLDACRLLLFQAARAVDRGSRDLLEPAAAKLFISEAAVATYLDAIRIHGAAGFTDELEFAEDLRDGVATVIFSGTSDILRQVIASELGL